MPGGTRPHEVAVAATAGLGRGQIGPISRAICRVRRRISRSAMPLSPLPWTPSAELDEYRLALRETARGTSSIPVGNDGSTCISRGRGFVTSTEIAILSIADCVSTVDQGKPTDVRVSHRKRLHGRSQGSGPGVLWRTDTAGRRKLSGLRLDAPS